jgi:hypothetical protein
MKLFQDNIIQNVAALNQLKIDYKSAIVAAEMIENGYPFNEIEFKNLSIFKRFVSKEIEKITLEEIEDQPSQLVIEINREGLYDMLPEAISHPAGKKHKDETTSEEFARHKEEENDARTFFNPIENEFQNRILYFELLERELLFNTNKKKDRQFFEYFFGNSSILDDRQMQTLLYILPLSYKIRGDQKLISLALSKILNYNVEVTKKYVNCKIEITEDQESDKCLGVNFVLSNFTSIHYWQYTINIYDVPVDIFPTFTNNGANLNIINFVIDYFFAVNADVAIVPHILQIDKSITLSEHNIHYLNFNTYL